MPEAETKLKEFKLTFNELEVADIVEEYSKSQDVALGKAIESGEVDVVKAKRKLDTFNVLSSILESKQ